MAKLKTVETSNSISKFIDAVKDETRRDDSYSLIKLMSKQTGFEPKMWGSSIVGFGNFHYKYASGHEGDMPLVGFSPRSTAIVFYFCGNYDDKKELLQKLGKHKAGKGCVYVKKLQDIDISVLEKMISNSIKYLESRRPDKK